MNALLTTAQAARALGVSESSLKRWCDQGRLPMQKTAGGHRRLPATGIMEFARTSGRPLAAPEVLGLPVLSGKGATTMDRARSELLDALIDGDEERVRCILFDLHLGSISWCDLGDRIIAPAFHQIGELWECGRAEVYVERRACGCLMRALDELRSGAFSERKGAEPAPLAIGAGAPGDGGALTSMLVELVLRGERWRAVSLGPNLPLSTLAAAVRDLRPRLVWISATHLERPESFLAEYSPFYEQMEQSGTPVAVGGRALAEDVRRRMKFAVYCESLARLVPFAAALRSPPGGANVA